MNAPRAAQAGARQGDVRRVLWTVLALNLLVTVAKVALGVWTGALSVVADGFHSLVDSSSNLVGLAALRLAARPADERHPYGYQRYETLGALAIGLLMGVSAWEILREVIARLVDGELGHISPWAVYGMLLALPINLFVSWWEGRRGRALNSEILLADAAHTRTDVLITLSVIAALVGVRLGAAWLDPLAALVVVGFILRAAWGIVSEAARYLADARVVDHEAVARLAQEVPGVRYVHHVRSRGKPGAAFVDLHVKVAPEMSTEQAHAIATEVERRLRQDLPGVADAMVHIEPARGADMLSAWEEILLRLRRIADGLGMGLHELHLHPLPQGGLLAEMHLEFAQEATLAQAYRWAQTFRQRVREELPQVGELLLHLEPMAGQMEAAEQLPEEIAHQVAEVVASRLPEGRVLTTSVYRAAGHLHAAVRVALPGAWPLPEAHRQADALQRVLLQRFPGLSHVAVEMAPLEEVSQPSS